MKQIILGISGSIAAYKAADIAAALAARGYDVHAVMTKAAAAFITPLTFQGLTKNRVYCGALEEDMVPLNSAPGEIVHISLAQRASLVLIAPASAHTIGKLASGLADDMLSSLVLALPDIPRFIAPAMNDRMYANPAVRENLSLLRARGWTELEPRESRLACGSWGKGALASVDTIVNAVIAACPVSEDR